MLEKYRVVSYQVIYEKIYILTKVFSSNEKCNNIVGRMTMY